MCCRATSFRPRDAAHYTRQKGSMMMKPLAVALVLLALPQAAQAQTFKSSAGDLKVETAAGGLVHPWALAFLPDGRLLGPERPRRMRIVPPHRKLPPPLGRVPHGFGSV